jgi:Holliday junction resolvase
MGKEENAVERYLHDKVTAAGGTTRKWVSPGRVGVPDRIVILPGGRVVFVEVKTDKGKLSVRQEREIEALINFGCEAYVVNGHNGVDRFLDKVWNAIPK